MQLFVNYELLVRFTKEEADTRKPTWSKVRYLQRTLPPQQRRRL